ncbi:MAG: VOC family protein [Sphingomonadales bacterium]|nr:VOC family protein [Sphingomonadales bacterium]MDE2168627.1 VOC family protein [Sphingomonadales bacterium]
MSTMHGNWIWYELMADDAHVAKSFYEAVVGWTITLDAVPTADPDTSYALIANADGGMTGGMLSITADMKTQGARTAWMGYIGVDDCAAALDAVVARGGKVWMPLTTLDVGTMAMVSDPTGAPFYIMTPTPPPGAGPSTAYDRHLKGRCGWNELYAGDAAQAIGFYTEMFGWSLPGSMDMGSFGTYQFIGRPGVEGEDATMGAIMPKPPHVPMPHWNFYFRVDDIPAAKAAIEANGGSVLNGPMEVPGGEWILQGQDPQGAFFSLVGMNPATMGH